LTEGSLDGDVGQMTGPAEAKVLARLLFGKPIDRLTEAERVDLDYLLGLDAAAEDLYERLALEYPEEDGDATRH
jgi:hypothetical protein